MKSNNRMHIPGSPGFYMLWILLSLTGLVIPQIMYGTQNMRECLFDVNRVWLKVKTFSSHACFQLHWLSIKEKTDMTWEHCSHWLSHSTASMRVNGSTKQWCGSNSKQKAINPLWYPPGSFPETCHWYGLFPYFCVGCSLVWKWASWYNLGAIRQRMPAGTGGMIVQVFCRLSQLWKSSNHPVPRVLSPFFFQIHPNWRQQKGGVKVRNSGYSCFRELHKVFRMNSSVGARENISWAMIYKEI